MPSTYTGIKFNNWITENDSINPLDLVNVYNGGGVGIGDFNNDKLADIYFSGNQVPNRLYINRGDFKFEDVTYKAGAGIDGMGRWGRGVAIVDINSDGLSDIYVCNTIYKNPSMRRNLLFINKGSNAEGIPHFIESAVEYGLDVNVQSTMANFFDYDNDGDLDMFLSVNEATTSYNPNRFGGTTKNLPDLSIDRLYVNNWKPGMDHPVYEDISQQAGIVLDGFSHASTIVDLNRDGWKDIYVSNDFLSENILYINNQDGTYTDRTKDYFKHTSYNAMGNDIVDINNDGLADIVELDMNPEDNYRKKMMLNSSNTTVDRNFGIYNLQYQYIRNTLQLNQGPVIQGKDSLGPPIFSEIGFMSGISQTDWSWAPLVADFNNNGFRDIIVTNGFPRDVTDHDFISYHYNAIATTSKQEIINKIPQIKLNNYAFANNGDLTFSDVTTDWGFDILTYSNGAATADFDNDGDLDLVVNNINDVASIYRNTAASNEGLDYAYLQIEFSGHPKNSDGLGTWVEIYYAGKHQVYEHNPYRGYLSSMQPRAHFGLGKTEVVDSVVVKWPNGKKQTFKNVNTNELLKVDIENATERYSWGSNATDTVSLFREITSQKGIDYKHRDFELMDFDIQNTLPHKLSEYCPALAVGDIDGNGLDDLVMGGNSQVSAQLFLQNSNGLFTQKALSTSQTTEYKDGGLLLFDANGDNTMDLYVVGSGYKHPENSPNYQDRLYLNDGNGNFTLVENALPENFSSKLCVRAMDVTADGKLDLFVSGRVYPWKYPKAVTSLIYRNDTENGQVKFTDITSEIAPDLLDIGMVSDALFTDFDNDQKTDLVLVGEWMPVIFLKNVNGNFEDVSTSTGIDHQLGWWNSIVAGDFRRTGRTDYIVGNVGLNTLFKASDQYPVYITAKDFDNNGGFEGFLSLYLKDRNGEMKEFPVNGRDNLIKRIPSMKKKYNDYTSYASADMDQVFPPSSRTEAMRLEANQLQSCYIRNEGGGKFTMLPLPKQAQISMLNGMIAEDFDGDGNLDLLINGNDFGTDVSIGRYDALNGLLLKGDGTGRFLPQSVRQSGIYIPGNGKALVKLRGSAGQYLVAASQNKDKLKLFELKRKIKTLPIGPTDAWATIEYGNDNSEKKEFYYGSSFLSQSGRFIILPDEFESIHIYDFQGRSRIISSRDFENQHLLP